MEHRWSYEIISCNRAVWKYDSTLSDGIRKRPLLRCVAIGLTNALHVCWMWSCVSLSACAPSFMSPLPFGFLDSNFTASFVYTLFRISFASPRLRGPLSTLSHWPGDEKNKQKTPIIRSHPTDDINYIYNISIFSAAVPSLLDSFSLPPLEIRW